MSSPSPETAAAPVYRPLPEGPSPRWKRAAEGLRLVRLGTWSLLLCHVVAVVMRIGSLNVPHLASGTSAVRTGWLFGALELVGSAVVAVGLWWFGGAPRSTGANRAARVAFAFFVATVAVPVLSGWLIRPLGGAGASMALISVILLLRSLVAIAVHGAYLASLVRALTVALRSVGEALPAWSRWLVTAVVTGRLLSIPAQNVLLMFQRSVINVPWLLVSIAADAAFVAALGALLVRGEAALARQESPEQG